jgi:hypothetical protein
MSQVFLFNAKASQVRKLEALEAILRKDTKDYFAKFRKGFLKA